MLLMYQIFFLLIKLFLLNPYHLKVVADMRSRFVDWNVRMADIDKYGADTKNVQDLTAFVQTLLQQMQDKFQNMSDQIINRNILLKFYFALIHSMIWLLLCSLTYLLLDDMGTRIDDLEKNIADLMTQTGVSDGGL
ncbi:hypothetical protein Btru_032363 [Bulinus truncatus]|nr:hypothetical protein Btru_032363 [Bulinus truncatus]